MELIREKFADAKGMHLTNIFKISNSNNYKYLRSLVSYIHKLPESDNKISQQFDVKIPNIYTIDISQTNFEQILNIYDNLTEKEYVPYVSNIYVPWEFIMKNICDIEECSCIRCLHHIYLVKEPDFNEIYVILYYFNKSEYIRNDTDYYHALIRLILINAPVNILTELTKTNREILESWFLVLNKYITLENLHKIIPDDWYYDFDGIYLALNENLTIDELMENINIIEKIVSIDERKEFYNLISSRLDIDIETAYKYRKLLNQDILITNPAFSFRMIKEYDRYFTEYDSERSDNIFESDCIYLNPSLTIDDYYHLPSKMTNFLLINKFEFDERLPIIESRINKQKKEIFDSINEFNIVPQVICNIIVDYILWR
jgi:hypothetical protein